MRRRKGLSQENLISIDRSYWGQIERGEANITIDVLIRIAALLEVEAASLILMATSLQSNEPFSEGLKRLTRQLNKVKKDGVDVEIELLAQSGKLPPGRPARSGAARKAAEANRLKGEGDSVTEISLALGLSKTTIRRYLTSKSDQS
jgi:transcriptional regulator with XRE-family HTH domain